MEAETKQFGVAHTAVTIADFMTRSAIDLLNSQGITVQHISALDPFTGDGIFLASLLSHGITNITAYEIRKIQSEQTAAVFPSARVLNVDAFSQQPKNCNLIIGNPPYGKCTKNEVVDRRIKETYGGSCMNQSALYDGYVRAIRWASDNLSHGLIAYIVNNSFLDSIVFANMRKRLESEFEKIYIFNLRGNHRTSGELCRKEGDNVFAQEARVGIAILFLERT